MNRGLYATAVGMLSTQKSLDVIANNLANVSTTGFKKDGLAFAEQLERSLMSNGQEIGAIGSGAVVAGEYTVFDQGPLTSTGKPLDVAIRGGKGMFAVQTPSGTRYTREGSFTIDADGQITTQGGYPLLNSAGSPILVPPGGKPTITESGQVMNGDVEVGTLGMYEGKFKKFADNLYVSDNATPMPETTLEVGILEGSNVNAIECMLTLVQMSRLFELAQKSVVQQDELTQRLIQSLTDR